MSEIFKEVSLGTPETDNQWSYLFEKVAEEHRPKTNEEHRQIVDELFHSKSQVMKQFDKWTEKVSFDTNKIKELYANTIH